MELIYLPSELIEEIASYLNFEDILVCLSVNLQWEEAFNLERIWSRFTTTIDPNYYGSQLSKMNYSPSSNPSQLEPCPSKELALRGLFVENNFLNGKFHTEEIDLGITYCDCIKDTVDKAGNHWLFVSISEGPVFQHRIQVWNLNVRPVLHSSSETPRGDISERPIGSQMKVIGDRLFYVQDDFVLIYEFPFPQYEFRFLHTIVLSKSQFPSQVFLLAKMICLPNIIVGFVYTELHIDQFLPPSYEVWGADSAPICNNFEQVDLLENVILTSFPIMCVRKNDLNHVIVIYEFYNHNCNRYNFALKVFDSKTLDYTEISVVKFGKLNTFDVCRNVAVLIYTVQNPNSYEQVMYVETYNIENGSSLTCNRLESKITSNGVSIRKVNLMVSWDVIAIGKKTLSVYRCTVDSLKHVLSFLLSKQVCSVSALNNHVIVAFYSKEDIIYELYSYKTASKLYSIELSPHHMTFSFKHKCSFPTNLIAYYEPDVFYAREDVRNAIFILSFW